MRFFPTISLCVVVLTSYAQLAQAAAPRGITRLRYRTSFRLDQYNDVNRLQNAIQFNPNNADAYIGLGRALYKECSWQEANEAFKSGLRLDSTSSLGWQHYGIALYKQGRLREAESAFRTALRTAPDDVTVYMGQYEQSLEYGLIDVLYDQEKWNETIVAYRAVAEIDADYYQDFYELGEAFLEIDDTENALTVFASIAHSASQTGIEPPYVSILRIYVQVADLLKEEGRLEAAEAWYRASIQRFRVGYRELIALLEEQGRTAEAEAVAAAMPRRASALAGLKGPLLPSATPRTPITFSPSLSSVATSSSSDTSAEEPIDPSQISLPQPSDLEEAEAFVEPVRSASSQDPYQPAPSQIFLPQPPDLGEAEAFVEPVRSASLQDPYQLPQLELDTPSSEVPPSAPSDVEVEQSMSSQSAAAYRAISEGQGLYNQRRYEEAEVAFRRALCVADNNRIYSRENRRKIQNGAALGIGNSRYQRRLVMTATEAYRKITNDGGYAPSTCELKEFLLLQEPSIKKEDIDIFLQEKPDESCHQ